MILRPSGRYIEPGLHDWAFLYLAESGLSRQQPERTFPVSLASHGQQAGQIGAAQAYDTDDNFGDFK